jgi:hypothetical protein
MYFPTRLVYINIDYQPTHGNYNMMTYKSSSFLLSAVAVTIIVAACSEKSNALMIFPNGVKLLTQREYPDLTSCVQGVKDDIVKRNAALNIPDKGHPGMYLATVGLKEGGQLVEVCTTGPDGKSVQYNLLGKGPGASP